MKARICVLVMVCIAAYFVLSGIQQPRLTGEEKATASGGMKVKWEYRTVLAPTADQLNELGKDGWELVAVATRTTADQVATCYLKRSVR